MKKKSALTFSCLEKEGENNFAESIVDELTSVFDAVSNKETSEKLSLAMSKLPGDYSEVISLHIKKGFNFREISQELKKPLNTVKSQYRRGLSLLRKILD